MPDWVLSSKDQEKRFKGCPLVFFFLKLKLTLLHVLPCIASGLSFVLEDSGKFGIATGGRVWSEVRLNADGERYIKMQFLYSFRPVRQCVRARVPTLPFITRQIFASRLSRPPAPFSRKNWKGVGGKGGYAVRNSDESCLLRWSHYRLTRQCRHSCVHFFREKNF